MDLRDGPATTRVAEYFAAQLELFGTALADDFSDWAAARQEQLVGVLRGGTLRDVGGGDAEFRAFLGEKDLGDAAKDPKEVLAFIEAHVVTQKDAVFGNRAGAFLKFGHQALASLAERSPEAVPGGGITITSLAALAPILISPQQRAAVFGDAAGALGPQAYRMLEIIFAFEVHKWQVTWLAEWIRENLPEAAARGDPKALFEEMGAHMRAKAILANLERKPAVAAHFSTTARRKDLHRLLVDRDFSIEVFSHLQPQAFRGAFHVYKVGVPRMSAAKRERVLAELAEERAAGAKGRPRFAALIEDLAGALRAAGAMAACAGCGEELPSASPLSYRCPQCPPGAAGEGVLCGLACLEDHCEGAHGGAGGGDPGPLGSAAAAAGGEGVGACAVCGAGGELKVCGGCKEVAYCSKEHQADHWKRGGHKAVCKKALAM